MRKLTQRICYFLSFAILFGCSQIPDPFKDDKSEVFGSKDFAESLVSGINAKWFKQPQRFSLQGDYGETPKHFFFDVNPDISLDKQTVNFVVETPEDSPYAYKIDLLSGQHYMHHQYCELRDAWDLFKESIMRPPYTLGIVPRVFDQLGEPQKVIVFGMKDYYQKNFKDNFFDGRVVGGYIEEVCKKGACLEKKQWDRRLVLIAVQKNNDEFKKVQNIDDLKKVVDWPSIKAFAENGHGHNQLGQKFYPSLKMGPIIDAKSALNFLRSHSIFFTVKKLTKMRNSCYTLYDHLWKELGELSDYEKKIEAAKTKEDFVALNKDYNKNVANLFYRRFLREFRKYAENIKTCMKYIYYGNVHEDSDRFWFFSQLHLFALAHDQGYTYNCRSGSWSRNPLKVDGKRVLSLKNEFMECSAHNVDNAFVQAANLLKTLKRSNHPSYRFIDYDGGSLGTHNKLYSWVPIPNKRYECSKNNEFYMTKPIIPKDIRWKKRSLDKMKKIRPYY